MTRIESLALRWHAARYERLCAQKELNKARNESKGWAPLQLLSALVAQKKEAKRLESRALRELNKACNELRLHVGAIEDGASKPKLNNNVIDI